MYNNLTLLASKADKNIKRFANEKIIPETELLNELRKYNLKDALIEIAYLCVNIHKNTQHSDISTFMHYDENLNFYFRCDSLAKLAHLFIKSGANDYKKKTISKQSLPNLIWLSNLVGNKLETKIEISDETIINQMCILFREQLEYQKDIVIKTYRNYLIFNESFGNEFFNITKLTLKEYYNTGLVLLACGYIKPHFTQHEIVKSIKDLNLSLIKEENILNILKYLSIDYKTYRSNLTNDESRNIFALQYKPIIKTIDFGKNLYIIPSPMFLTEKIFNGVYFDIEASYDSKMQFREKFGHVFEQYVGNFIKYYEKEAKIFSEQELIYTKNGNEAKFTDWTVIKDNKVFLIEVKSAVVPLKDVYNTSIKDYIKTHIIDAYKQIIDKINDIDVYDELKNLKDKEIIPIVIFKDVLPLYNSLFKKEFDSVINEIKQQEKYSCLKNRHLVDLVILMNLDNFELYWTNKEQINIKEIYKEAIDNQSESIKSLILKNKNLNLENEFLYSVSEEIFPSDKLLACKNKFKELDK